MMTKIFSIVVPLMLSATFASAAGGPIPGVDVSLEQIPGGVYPTPAACRAKTGKVVRNGGKTYCQRSMNGSGPVDDNGDFTLKAAPVKKCGIGIKLCK